MASSSMPGKRQPALEPVDEELDHIRGPVAAPDRIGVTILTGLTGVLVSKSSVGPP